jgi:cyclophilin family peptidyl-prolyl cis-trans isomerase
MAVLVLWLLAPGGVSCALAQNPTVVLETNLGDIVIELYPGKAPITVDNFLNYVNSGFYDYLLFHRVIKNFMIQGGGYYYYNGIFYRAQTLDPIINESSNGLKNLRGTIAMARTTEPDSATSEFYINHIDNPHLDRENAADGVGYCVFGHVVEGMDVVDTIAQIPTTQYYQDNPLPPIYFEAIPQNLVGMYRAYVLPCGVSYCSDFAATGRISFDDFAMFAARWLDGDCVSSNGFCDVTDLDYSGSVDIADLELFIDHWTRGSGYEPEFSDLAGSAAIDINDLSAFITQWLDSGCNDTNNHCTGADINHNGTVDFEDFALFANNWLISY